MTGDPQLGLIYLSVSPPTNDYFGGTRPGEMDMRTAWCASMLQRVILIGTRCTHIAVGESAELREAEIGCLFDEIQDFVEPI
jgi:hypothetical protein